MTAYVEINISEMWVKIEKRVIRDGFSIGGDYSCDDHIYETKPMASVSQYTETAAVVTVKDWHDICQGKRNLIIGEGLE